MEMSTGSMGFSDEIGTTCVAKRIQKDEGDISAVFASLAGDAIAALPRRYGELKGEIIGDNGEAILASWKRLLPIVAARVCEAKVLGSSVFRHVEVRDFQV